MVAELAGLAAVALLIFGNGVFVAADNGFLYGVH